MRCAALLLLLSSACGVTAAPTIETATHVVVVAPPPGWTFEPTAGTGPAIFLEPIVVEDTRAIFALRATGLSPLHGVAFRLVYAPEQAELVGFQPSPEWATAPLLEVVEARPGTVAGVMSRHGPTGAVSAAELGRIELKLKTTQNIDLRFERTRAQGDAGARIEATWRAGVLRR